MQCPGLTKKSTALTDTAASAAQLAWRSTAELISLSLSLTLKVQLHVGSVQIMPLSFGRFLPSVLAWHCRHCNIDVTVLLTAATCWPQLLLLWPLTSNPDIASYLLTIAVVIFKINVISPHTASHCQVSQLLSRFYFRNISASYRYTGCTFCGLPEHESISAKQDRAVQEFRTLGDTSMK